MTYYNEFDLKAAAWLRELIAQNIIALGHVDTRSITEVSPSDLKGYTQCHFFAGIGGWSYALRLSGWPDDKPVWTGSCPCQPFSVAGKGRGTADERHLWPVFAELIKQCKPSTVFGEQVASKAGREWLSGVFTDLEALGYQRAGADLCAAGVGASHIRQRLYWVAHNSSPGLEEREEQSPRPEQQTTQRGSDVGRLGNPRREQADAAESGQSLPSERLLRCWDASRLIECRDGKHRRIPTEPSFFPLAHGVSGRVGLLRGYGNAIVPQVAAEFISAFCEC